MTGPSPTRADLRRRGWHEWRAAAPRFLTPRRRAWLVVVAVVVGSLAAVAVDRVFVGDDDLDWAGALRVVAPISLAAVAAALGVAAVVGVSLRHDRRDLAPVSWRDDRLVLDYSSPGAPELSATLAPRLLASARKQHVGMVGSVTLLLGLSGALALAVVGVVGVTVAAGFPGLGFAGALVSAISLPFSVATSLETLGRASVAIDLATAHPAVEEARTTPADR